MNTQTELPEMQAKVQTFNAGIAFMFKRKGLLEIPAIGKEVTEFFSKTDHSIDEARHMKEILRDAKILMQNMENCIDSHIVVE
jgi:hypothetical protein